MYIFMRRVILGISFWVGAAYTAEREALVIGNTNYQSGTLGKLTNPANDANAMAKQLEKLGFHVTLLQDLTAREMRHSVVQFGKRINKDTKIALFYYAGHGAETQGVGYLIPIDAVVNTQAEIDAESINVDYFLSHFARAGAHTNIMILDACRNMPFVRGTNQFTGIEYKNYPQTWVAYSTKSGEAASDGFGEQNSPYTAALLKQLKRPGLRLFDVFNEVGRTLITEYNQQPWLSTSLGVDNLILNTSEQPSNPPQPTKKPVYTPNRETVSNADRNLVKSMNATLDAYQRRDIVFPERVLAVSEYSNGYCDSDHDFNNVSRALMKLTGYYYYFRKNYNGYYPYGVYGSNSLYDDKSHQSIEIEKIDKIMQEMDSSILEANIKIAISLMNSEEKKDFQALANHFKQTYENFRFYINANAIMQLNEKSNRNIGLSSDDFYQIGFPKDSFCFDEVNFYYTNDIHAPRLFGTNNTYFSYSNPMNFYFYSFWLRRYNAGTFDKSKQLLDFVINELSN